MNESENIPKWDLRWTASSCLMVSLLYLAFVYRGWDNISDLIDLMPPFLILALAAGFVFSGLPLEKPFSVTILSTTPAPLFSYMMALLINEFVKIAHAAAPGNRTLALSDTDPGFLVLYFLFFIIIGLIFGIVACLGCLLGKILQKAIVSVINIPNKNSQPDSDKGVKASIIGARATLAAGVIGVVGSIIVAFMS